MGFWSFDNYTYDTFYGGEKLRRLMETDMKFKEGAYYVGITANPMLSFKAHGIDIYDRYAFESWEVPFEKAKSCKDEILAMDIHEWIFDSDSDYIDETCKNLFIYLYNIRSDTIQHISTSAFTPLKKRIPNPIVLKYINNDGTQSVKRFGEEFSDNDCDLVLSEIKAQILEKKLYGLVVKHRSLNFIEFQFGDDCAVINFEPNTLQEGAGYGYRNGSKSRKKVTFYDGEYPEYMVCHGIDIYMDILNYFLKKDKKPGKRQNVKWAYMAEDKDIRKYCNDIKWL